MKVDIHFMQSVAWDFFDNKRRQDRQLSEFPGSFLNPAVRIHKNRR